MNEHDATERLIDAKVSEKLSTTKRLTGWTLIGLVAANISAIFGFKSCIQEAAINSAEAAVGRRLNTVESNANQRIQKYEERIVGQFNRVLENEKKVALTEEKTNSLLKEIKGHEKSVKAAMDNVAKGSVQLRKFVEALGMTQEKQISLMNLLSDVDTNKLDDFLRNVDKRVSAVELPIGAIIPWHRNYLTVDGRPVSRSVPYGWVECSGPTPQDSESALDMAKIPNLNDGFMLHGNAKSGLEDYLVTTINRAGINLGMFQKFKQGEIVDIDVTWEARVGASSSTLINGFNVVWIMRVK